MANVAYGVKKMEEKPKPPLAGVVYGEIAFTLVVVGGIISLIGIGMYLSSGGYMDKSCLLSELWSGKEAHEIWEKCAGEVPHGHWYLSKLGNGDAIAMAGIAVACLGGVFGLWGLFVALVKSKEKPMYIGFAFVVAVILTLAAMGIITIKH